jgi:hypothetical protein
MKLEHLFPYVIHESYLAKSPRPGVTPPHEIGHGCRLAVAEHEKGVAWVKYPGDAERKGFDWWVVLRRAFQNLTHAVARNEIPIARTLGPGPEGATCLVFGPEWRAASCLFLPDLFANCSTSLGTTSLRAMIPHRELMVVFRGGDARYESEMRAFVAKMAANGRQPLTLDVFAVEEHGVRPLASRGASGVVTAVTAVTSPPHEGATFDPFRTQTGY